ncbi:MAG: hypothetical protein ACREXJ_00145 [Gammaproteobacteria bacterium]
MGRLFRVPRTAAGTLTHSFFGADGETPLVSSTTVTVDVTDANGAAVADDAATTVASAVYSYALPGQAQLAELTVAWSGTIGGAAVVETDTAEIVGGFLFSLAELRDSDESLREQSGGVYLYSTADLALARIQTEVECEWICDRAFVPRYRRVVLGGGATTELLLGVPDVRSIRAVRVAEHGSSTFTALTAAELAALIATDDGLLVRGDGQGWTWGQRNVIVECEHGLDRPPEDLKRAALRRARSWVQIGTSKVPERAFAYTTNDGASYRLSRPDAFHTGIADVDSAYAKYSLRDLPGQPGGDNGRPVPASRTLDYNPQHYSLFHGGVR